MDIPVFESEPPALLVPDLVTLSQINQIASQPQKLQSGTRKFCVWDAVQDYGWVTSVPYNDHAWVSSLYVHSKHRGKGFGRSLMSKLLQSDRENGVKQSVLLASSDGARLYPHLGYQQIGILQMFCPIKRS
jgi:L-amino acid N-acyltransferase YncA